MHNISDTTRGQLHWSERGVDALALIGRAEQVDAAHGMTTSYACQNCCQDSFYSAFSMADANEDFTGDTVMFSPAEVDVDCYGTLYSYNVGGLVWIDWFSFNLPVATVDENGVAMAQAAGSATIRSSWYVTVWHFDLLHGECRPSTQQALVNALNSVLETRANRGRIQAQGSNPPLQVSRAWAQQDPPSKFTCVELLDQIWDQLTASQRRERQQAYEDARSFIQSAPQDGYPATSRHFYDPQRRDPNARIDIEIITGRAFVGPY